MKLSIGKKKEENNQGPPPSENHNIPPQEPDKRSVNISEANSQRTPRQVSQQNQQNNYQVYHQPPAIDIDSIKAEIMKTIQEEDERKKKEREEASRKREKELEEIEKKLKEEKESLSDSKKFGRKSKMLAKISAEDNEDYYTNYKIRLRNQKMKSFVFSSLFIFLIVAILGCNVYFMFFKKETPIETIKATVKKDLRVYSFPADGVQEYLENNFKTLVDKNITITGGSGANNWDIQKLRIRKINAFSDQYANVFFSVNIGTAIGSAEHNYIITLKYNYDDKIYMPASNLIIRTTSFIDETEMKDEDDIIWGFGEQKSKDTTELQQFLEQYYILMYNNKTYPSASLNLKNSVVFDNEGLMFNFIDKIEWYDKANYMGANCKVTYNVQSSEGLTFLVTNYLAIVQDTNNNFKITAVF